MQGESGLENTKGREGGGAQVCSRVPQLWKTAMSSSPESHWAGTMGTRPFTVQLSLYGQGGRVGACAAHVPSALLPGCLFTFNTIQRKKMGVGDRKKKKGKPNSKNFI